MFTKRERRCLPPPPASVPILGWEGDCFLFIWFDFLSEICIPPAVARESISSLDLELLKPVVSGYGYPGRSAFELLQKGCCRASAQAWVKPRPRNVYHLIYKPGAANVNRFLSLAFPHEKGH